MLNGLHQLAFIGPGGPEILVVMLVLLLMFGAKDAPRIFRKINDMLNQFRSTAESFKREVMYSDLGNEPKPDRAADDYDDYGVGSQENGEGSNEELDDAVTTEDCPFDGDAESDSMPDTVKDEGGDVQKN
jgi:Sec-independent protein translocase protein TatA